MKNSYKNLSDTFFACFIGFIIGFIFFGFLSNLCLCTFSIQGFIISRFFRSISIIASIVFIALSGVYSILSTYRKEEALDCLNSLYKDYKEFFLISLKKYFILKINNQENSEDFKYFINDFKDISEKYNKETMRYINILKAEKFPKISSDSLFPDYINKIYTGIIEDCIDINQFMDSKVSINSFVYEDKINYIYKNETNLYLFKDLFIAALEKENLKIEKLFE